MDAREAVAAAKQHVVEMFADEQIHSVGLEEIRLQKGPDAGWVVTIGFARDWRPNTSLMRTMTPPPRTYKIITLDENDGTLKSISHRDIPTERPA